MFFRWKFWNGQGIVHYHVNTFRQWQSEAVATDVIAFLGYTVM